MRAVQQNFGELVYIQLAANINNGRRMEFNDTLLAKLLQTKGSGQKVSFFHSTHPASTPQTVHGDIIRFKNALQAVRSHESYDESALAVTACSS